ncbi:unnamed protein product, partial [Rotaria magnacalcarata]
MKKNYYQRQMSLQEIMNLLKRYPCAFIENEIEQNRRTRRDSNAGNLDIHALQTTINDHRTMINYLINNS